MNPSKEKHHLPSEQKYRVLDEYTHNIVDYQLKFEKMVAEVSNVFLSATAANITKAYAYGLQRLGEFFAVDRSYLFQLSPDGKTMENLCEWCAPGIRAQRVEDISFKLDDLPWWAEHLRRHENVYIAAAELLPPAADAEKQECARQEIKSLLSVPLVAEGQLMGFMGFDSVNKEKEWTKRQIGLLKIVAESISAALVKIKAEQETVEANLRLLTVLEGMDANVNVVDMQSHEILFINRSGQELWGDVVGQKCWQVMHEGQTGPCAFCSNDKLLDAAGWPAGVYCWEYQNTKTKNWYECRDTALRWLDGRIVRLQMATDITARKKTEKALQETLERLGALLENTPNPIAILDGEGRFVEISAAASRKIGLIPGAARGKTYTELLSAELAASFRQAIAEVQQKRQVITKTTAVLDRDGKTIYETWFFPVKQSVSAVELVGTIMLDITELKHSQQEALQASRIKSEFLAKISHELRTPLHAILNYADFGMEEVGSEDRERLEDYFQKIHYSATRLFYLINDLLDISRIEAGIVKYIFQQHDIYELARLAGEELDTLLQEKEIELENIKPVFATVVKADRNRILQVLRNLFHNALKFSPRGSTIKVTYSRNLAAPPSLELHIVDEGPGIPPQEYIFSEPGQNNLISCGSLS